MSEKIRGVVIQAFQCKISGDHFSVGDTYVSEDQDRISSLQELGYLSMDEPEGVEPNGGAGGGADEPKEQKKGGRSAAAKE